PGDDDELTAPDVQVHVLQGVKAGACKAVAEVLERDHWTTTRLTGDSSTSPFMRAAANHTESASTTVNSRMLSSASTSASGSASSSPPSPSRITVSAPACGDIASSTLPSGAPWSFLAPPPTSSGMLSITLVQSAGLKGPGASSAPSTGSFDAPITITSAMPRTHALLLSGPTISKEASSP